MFVKSSGCVANKLSAKGAVPQRLRFIPPLSHTLRFNIGGSKYVSRRLHSALCVYSATAISPVAELLFFRDTDFHSAYDILQKINLDVDGLDKNQKNRRKQ